MHRKTDESDRRKPNGRMVPRKARKIEITVQEILPRLKEEGTEEGTLPSLLVRRRR